MHKLLKMNVQVFKIKLGIYKSAVEFSKLKISAVDFAKLKIMNLSLKHIIYANTH
jgi:hypothetical protein